MNDSGNCHRCKLPIVGTCYTFRLEANPPVLSAKPVDVSICTACLESMQRWMERPRRHAEMASIGPDGSSDLVPARSERRKSSRRKKSSGRARYAHQLLASENGIRIRTALTISVVVMAFATLFVLIAVEITTGTPRFSLGRPEQSHKTPPTAPIVPPVDRPDAFPLE